MNYLRHKMLKLIKKNYFFIKYLFVPKTHLYEDGYIQYMSYICSGDMLEKGNIYAWDYVIKHLKTDSPILEIGAFAGLSTNILTYLVDKLGKNNNIYTVDYWQLKPDDNVFFKKNYKFQKYNEFVKKSFIRNTKFFSEDNLPLTFHMNSRKFFSIWKSRLSIEDLFGRDVQLGMKFSFCFIDGDHSYEGVKKDFLDADSVLENGGFLMFDDSSDGSGWDGINRVMYEVIKTKKYNLVMKNPNYLFQKK